MIAFTIDIDWAPEEIISDTLSVFEKYNVKCTAFSTHPSPVLSKCRKDLFEIGIHPNFNPLLQGSEKKIEDIIDELLKIYPEAKGVRSHSMLQNTGILQEFARKNLIYDANHFLPYQKGIKPFKLWTGMVRIPFNWEDDIHWTYGYTFDSSNIDLNEEGLNIFNFHPIHIFLNTESKNRYEKAKEFYKDPRELRKYRNSQTKGSRDMLISLLEYVNEKQIITKNLLEIANDFLKGERQ
jgi:hypothetical protein